jgi:hypothetical protein
MLSTTPVLSMTKTRDSNALQAVVLVAFDPESGRVHGTYTHGSLGAPDDAGSKRAGDQFLRKLARRQGGSAKIDAIRVPLDEIKDTWVECADPATHKIIKATRVAP